jgi:predicted  nucleic acid-binding Zn-ribbon protein
MTDNQTNLAWRLAQLEAARKEEHSATETLEKEIGSAQIRIKDLEREVVSLRELAADAQTKAMLVARTLEIKEREAAAEDRARSLVAKWLQIFLGGAILVVTLWSSRWISALDQLRTLLK